MNLLLFLSFDDLHYNDIDRAIKDMAISDDGQVAFVGWHGHTFLLYIVMIMVILILIWKLMDVGI